jgi:hypothetical protein
MISRAPITTVKQFSGPNHLVTGGPNNNAFASYARPMENKSFTALPVRPAMVCVSLISMIIPCPI